MDSPHQHGCRQVGMQPQEVVVVPIPDEVRIEAPGPGHVPVSPFAAQGRAMKQVQLRRVTGHRQQGRAPPVEDLNTNIIAVDVLVSVRREDVVVIVRVICM